MCGGICVMLEGAAFECMCTGDPQERPSHHTWTDAPTMHNTAHYFLCFKYPGSCGRIKNMCCLICLVPICFYLLPWGRVACQCHYLGWLLQVLPPDRFQLPVQLLFVYPSISSVGRWRQWMGTEKRRWAVGWGVATGGGKAEQVSAGCGAGVCSSQEGQRLSSAQVLQKTPAEYKGSL